MRILPVGTKLIVLPLPQKEEKLDSGIYVPGTANANLMEGKVVEVSPEISHLYAVGDIVLYPEKKGTGCIIDGLPHLWLDAQAELKEIWGIADYVTEPKEK